MLETIGIDSSFEDGFWVVCVERERERVRVREGCCLFFWGLFFARSNRIEWKR